MTSDDPNCASVLLAHRHGPCAPASASTGGEPFLAERLRRDLARRSHIISRASGRTVTPLSDAAGVRIPASLGAAVDSLQYVVTLGLGTPVVQQTVLIDTGRQRPVVGAVRALLLGVLPGEGSPLRPRASSTYAPVPCGTDACRALANGYGNGCANSTGAGTPLCQYGIQYGNLDITVGVYSTETLTLKPGVAVKNFSFGCGLHQQGTFENSRKIFILVGT